MDHLLAQLLELGCSPADSGDAQARLVERDQCAPEDFYSTSNHRTWVRLGGEWVEVAEPADGRHDRRQLEATRSAAGCAISRPAIWWSRACVESASFRNRRSATVWRSPSCRTRFLPNVRWRPRSPDRCHWRVRRSEQGKTIVAVAGPVVIHTGGAVGLSKLIRDHWIDALLGGNALGVHDIESALFGTSLGVNMADGRQAEHGHRNHMRAINAIHHAGGIKGAVESGTAAIRRDVRVREERYSVRAGRQPSRRWPAAGDDHRYERGAGCLRAVLKPAGLVLCLGSMLHSIATGNMLPSWVQIVCVDINPAVATKVSDRGTGQAVGVVTDVGLFLDLLSRGTVGDPK